MELHPDKTRIIELGRFALENPRARGQGKSYAADHLPCPQRLLLPRALALAALPAAPRPATQADVAEDDADCGALAA